MRISVSCAAGESRHRAGSDRFYADPSQQEHTVSFDDSCRWGTRARRGPTSRRSAALLFVVDANNTSREHPQNLGQESRAGTLKV